MIAAVSDSMRFCSVSLHPLENKYMYVPYCGIKFTVYMKI